MEELHAQASAGGAGRTPYAGLGARIEQILGLAEEEAKELRDGRRRARPASTGR